MTSAERKAILLAQGAIYRSELSSAQVAVKVNLRTESLAQSVVRNIGLVAFAALKSRADLSSVGLRTILPLLLGGVSALSKKSLLKPLLRGALIAGAVTTVVSVVASRKKTGKRAGKAGAG